MLSESRLTALERENKLRSLSASAVGPVLYFLALNDLFSVRGEFHILLVAVCLSDELRVRTEAQQGIRCRMSEFDAGGRKYFAHRDDLSSHLDLVARGTGGLGEGCVNVRADSCRVQAS